MVTFGFATCHNTIMIFQTHTTGVIVNPKARCGSARSRQLSGRCLHFMGHLPPPPPPHPLGHVHNIKMSRHLKLDDVKITLHMVVLFYRLSMN